MTKRNRRLLLISVILGVAAVSAGLVLTALSSTVAYFYTPSDLQKMDHSPSAMIRLGGLVETGSVRFDEGDKTAVNFVIRDEIAKTAVTYRGVLPDLFREGQGVIVQGKIDPAGRVIASEVLAKHDENYMPKEVADALKKQGRWKEGETP
jgi:cytochrome c-type biogenesis protein CcmE